MTPWRHILDAFATQRVLVVGDLILDRYAWGVAERVSPEAPVLVLQAEQDEVRLGGAASVAMLLTALDSDVELAGVIGDDATGRTLLCLLADARIEKRLIVTDSNRQTTVKERIVGRTAGRQPHQIVRLDRETRRPIAGTLEDQLIEATVERLANCDVLCVADYDKGVCTPRLLQALLGEAAARGVPSIVDPARVTDYLRYVGATLVKPNRVEAELASGRSIHSPEDAMTAGQILRERFNLASIVVTLDADGMVLVNAEGGQYLATTPRQVSDVTGAGDMTLAMLGLGVASGLSWPETIRLANLAAGLQVERFGVVPITRAELAAAVSPAGEALSQDACSPEVGHTRRCREKIVALDVLLQQLVRHRRSGQTIVFTNGCFDLLHVGHVRLLEEAGALGDVLVVAVNGDASVRQLKGPTRPIIAAEDRATVLAALGCVDYVLVFDDPTPHRLLEAVRPDVLAKGGTYTHDEVVGHEIVEAYGGRVCLTSRIDGVSTTRILARLEADRSSAGRPTIPLPPGEGRGEGGGNSASPSAPTGVNTNQNHPNRVAPATGPNESSIHLHS
ncbi:MAG TPA: D-glycero-beta-D-manno-heptose 1-phosphate adenylyltransferase [Pirellulales bacterium]|jgi:D-beta-D-heptose 7-phosphate kinase/D-beta-D-heptose 1-phosphate adenosyltransferase|nr:D-glycero-beta-D-manno-heptose 1-phosphate adenylyltransferase [Pirellulales bacterium]